MAGSVQRSVVQSWARFHLKWDLNPGPLWSKVGSTNQLATRMFLLLKENLFSHEVQSLYFMGIPLCKERWIPSEQSNLPWNGTYMYSKTCVREPPLRLTLNSGWCGKSCLSYKGTWHVILQAKLHDMYLYKTTTFPHQPLKSISKVAVLYRFYCIDFWRFQTWADGNLPERDRGDSLFHRPARTVCWQNTEIRHVSSGYAWYVYDNVSLAGHRGDSCHNQHWN